MLKPEYFNDKADRMIEIYRELEDYILKDISGRLLETQSVSGTADRMIWKLQQMGESRAEIMKKLVRITGLSRKELKAILQDAVMTSWKDDLSTFNNIGIKISSPLENEAVRTVMNAEYIKCQGELENLTMTAMEQSMNDLIEMFNKVEIRIASGVQSYSSAICEILDNYAKKGIEVKYPTGTKRSLEAAVRMCVVTSMNQTSAQITNQYIAEGNVEYVLVSAHLGARIQGPGQPYLAGHENWQGKVYKIKGSEPGFPNLLKMTGYDIDDSGKGKVVNPLGLHGYNCRHSHGAWDKTLKNPYVDENGKSIIDTEENRKLYKLQQKQRAMERAIRKTKKQLLVKKEEINKIAETDVREILQQNYDEMSYKLRMQNKAYSEFCDKNKLQRQSERLKVAGFKRKHASEANGRASIYKNLNEKTNVDNSYNEEGDGFKKISNKIKASVNDRNEHEPVKLTEWNNQKRDSILKIIDSKANNINIATKKNMDAIKIINEKLVTTAYSNRKGIAFNVKKDAVNKRGQWTTIFHEIGHAIDRNNGRISLRYPEFRKCLISDFDNIAKEYQREYNVNESIAYKEIGEKLALDPKLHSVSDLCGGITQNKCMGNHGHYGDGYWDVQGRLEREAFAHFYEATIRNDTKKISYIKSVFPNAYDIFEKMIEVLTL